MKELLRIVLSMAGGSLPTQTWRPCFQPQEVIHITNVISSLGTQLTCSRKSLPALLPAPGQVPPPPRLPWNLLVARLLAALGSNWSLSPSIGLFSTWLQRDPGLIPGSGRSPGEGNGNTLQYSCLENSVGYNLWGQKESDMTERLHFRFLLG